MRSIVILIILFSSFYSYSQNKKWTLEQLSAHWANYGLDQYEGIYANIVPKGTLNPQYLLALVNYYGQYELVFLNVEGDIYDYNRKSNRKISNKWRWSFGDIKAKLYKTSTNNVYNANWIKGNKTVTDQLNIYFGEKYIAIDWHNNIKDNYYLKVKFDDNGKLEIDSIEDEAIQSFGSGFAVSSQGLITTNYHVIKDAKKVFVHGVNGDFNTVYYAEVIKTDKNNDLALIKIKDQRFTSINNIPYTLKYEKERLGENVFVLGYPSIKRLGIDIKLTNGIISSTSPNAHDNLYQITAPVYYGNSGGPVFNEDGDVIGILNAGQLDIENTAYCIKSTELFALMRQTSENSILGNSNFLKVYDLPDKVERIKNFVYILEVYQ